MGQDGLTALRMLTPCQQKQVVETIGTTTSLKARHGTIQNFHSRTKWSVVKRVTCGSVGAVDSRERAGTEYLFNTRSSLCSLAGLWYVPSTLYRVPPLTHCPVYVLGWLFGASLCGDL